MVRKLIALLMVMVFILSVGCKQTTTPETIHSQVDMSSEETSNTYLQEGYKYTIFYHPEDIYLPIDIEEYIYENADERTFLLDKMLTDYGWQKADGDGTGSFELYIREPLDTRDMSVEGDYYYYDCGDMWVRLHIGFDYHLYGDKEMIVPGEIDYSFIMPEEPGVYFYSFENSILPTDNFDVYMCDWLDDNYLFTDCGENTYIPFDYAVFLTYLITWVDINPYESPLYYFGCYTQYCDDERLELQRDHFEC